MIVVYYCFEDHMSRYGTRQRSFAVSGNVHEILQGNNGITVYYTIQDLETHYKLMMWPIHWGTYIGRSLRRGSVTNRDGHIVWNQNVKTLSIVNNPPRLYII